MVVVWRFNQLNLQAIIMKKILLQFLLLVFSFFATWFLLSRVDWETTFNVKELTKTTEEKLGELIIEVEVADEKEITNKDIITPIDSIITRICKANKIDNTTIKVHVVKSEEINAFALPNRHLIINSQLIADCENPEELSGVLAHEIAHMELNHVMKKLVQEIGLSALLSVTKGKDVKVLKEIAKTLSSSAYSRNLEKEADMKGADYLIQADINPKYLGVFLFRLSNTKSAGSKYISWINSHPDSEERATYLDEYSSKQTIREKPVLSQATWSALKEDIHKH